MMAAGRGVLRLAGRSAAAACGAAVVGCPAPALANHQCRRSNSNGAGRWRQLGGRSAMERRRGAPAGCGGGGVTSVRAMAGGKPLARAVRPLPIRVVTISKKNSRGAALMAEEYADKIRNYTKFEEVQVKPNPKNSSDPEVQKVTEGEKVLKLLNSGDLVVVLDERGKEVTSEDLANLIGDAADGGFSSIAFCIGGPYGHSKEMLSRGKRSIRLSRMVLNHQVAHVVLLEQIYRAWTILRGEPYHH